MVDWSQFTTNGGTRIDFARVAQVGVGTIFGAVFTGVASVLLGLVDIPIALVGGLGDFLGTIVRVTVGLPGYLIRGAFAEAAAFVIAAGPAGWLVALGIVAATLYVVAWGVNQLG